MSASPALQDGQQRRSARSTHDIKPNTALARSSVHHAKLFGHVDGDEVFKPIEASTTVWTCSIILWSSFFRSKINTLNKIILFDARFDPVRKPKALIENHSSMTMSATEYQIPTNFTGGKTMPTFLKSLISSTFAALCSLSIATPLLADKISGSDIYYQSWEGAAYTDDKTGKFSHCAISADYLSGNTLYFSVNSDVSITVAVAGDLRLQPGSQFPVALYVDRRRPIYGTAYAHDEGFATLNIQDLSSALHAFRKGYTLRIESQAGSSSYSLKGTYRALEAAMNCAKRHYTHVAERPRSQIDKSGLFQLATVIIADMGLPNFRYLTEAELEEQDMSGTVAWLDEGASVLGIVARINHVEGTSLQETDAEDTQWVAGHCAGDLATYARSIPSTESGIKGREIRLLCNEDGDESQAFVNKFIHADNVYYTVLIFGPEYEQATPAAQNERSYLKSVSYVTGQQ